MSAMLENSDHATPIVRTVITIAWISFLLASIATMLFFATFNPETLIQITTFPIKLSPISIYSIGFFLFWLLTASTAAMSCYLLSPPKITQ